MIDFKLIYTYKYQYMCNLIYSTTFSVMESKPAPLGIVQSTSSITSNSVQVALAGDVIINTDTGTSTTTSITPFIASQTYYSTTTGDIITGTKPIASDYIYDASRKVYVSLDSEIGIALSDNTIHLTL